ncbi:hypothetical protein Dimus_009264 [Dionaea muscipula]
MLLHSGESNQIKTIIVLHAGSILFSPPPSPPKKRIIVKKKKPISKVEFLSLLQASRKPATMFKTKLQELCHRNLWALPSYTSIRDGPEHAPRFRASVVINGLSFSSSLLCRSSKEAQNEAARLAFIHFSPPPSSTHLPKSPVSPVTAGSNPAFSGDIRELKIEDEDAIAILKTHSPSPQGLREDSSSQQKMQKPNPWKNLSSPLFSFTRTTETVPPPHHKACSVSDMVDGCCIFGREDPKEAELDAATRSRAALDLESSSLDPTGSQVDTGGCFYKKRLLELVRREGLALPSYKMMKFGASHMPTFYCSVEIDGEVFQGKGAKCKKQAENNAAQVAYTTFIEFEDSAATYHDKMKGPPQVKPGSRTILHNEQYRESGGTLSLLQAGSLSLLTHQPLIQMQWNPKSSCSCSSIRECQNLLP